MAARAVAIGGSDGLACAPATARTTAAARANFGLFAMAGLDGRHRENVVEHAAFSREKW
jgi:hypothetical protein